MSRFNDNEFVPDDDVDDYDDLDDYDELSDDDDYGDDGDDDYDELSDDDDYGDDGDDDYDDDDYDDDLEDASEDEIDFVVALYNDDGERVAVPMEPMLANDFDELITQLRRLPGDAGAVGMVSIDHQFYVIVRVRGRNVQVFLSDATQANDWPIARDVADFLGEDIPDPDDDPETMGDGDMLADAGLGEFDMEAFADADEDSDEILSDIAARVHFGPQFERAANASAR
ncbi:tRNA adenosine deaminase-associated protein [Cutibacterium acnes]